MFSRILTIATAALVSTGVQAATLTGFSTWEDSLVSIDTDTGTVTVIGGDYTGLYNTIVGLDYDSSGVLWGIAGSSAANVSIGTINPTTGEYTLIGTDNVGSLSGAAFAPDDTLYSRDAGHPTDFVAEISKTDATPTRLADLGVTTAAGFAISDDGLYGYTIDVGTDSLLRYDFTAGTVSTIGVTSADISALAFSGSTLFATTDNAADALVTIDPLTGAELTRVSLSTGAFSNISALAGAPTIIIDPDPDPDPITPVPVPAGGLLLISGLGLIVLRRKHSRA